MLGTKCNELLARSVITKFFRGRSLILKHEFKKRLPMAAPLNRLMHVEIEDAERLDLLDSPGVSSDKQISLAYLDHSNDLFPTGSHVKSIV